MVDMNDARRVDGHDVVGSVHCWSHSKTTDRIVEIAPHVATIPDDSVA